MLCPVCKSMIMKIASRLMLYCKEVWGFLTLFFFLMYILKERLRLPYNFFFFFSIYLRWKIENVIMHRRLITRCKVQLKYADSLYYVVWFTKKKKRCQITPISISMNMPLTWTNHVESTTHYICNILESISVILYFHFLTQFSLFVWSWGCSVI